MPPCRRVPFQKIRSGIRTLARPIMPAPRVALVVPLVVAVACATAIPVEETAFAPSLGVSLDAMEPTESGLYLQDLRPGQGPEAALGDRLAIHYAGWLADGTQFDLLAAPDEPAVFVAGEGDIVPGLDEGVVGMRAGGQRRIVVPSELGYGSLGAGRVPPDAVLVFVVDLVEIR